MRGLIKTLTVIAVLALIFRTSYALGADTALDSYVKAAFGEEEQVASAVISQSPLLMANKSGTSTTQSLSTENDQSEEVGSESNEQSEEAVVTEEKQEAIEEQPEETEQVQETESSGDSNIQEKTITTGSGDAYISADGLYVKNETTYDLDIQSAVNQEISPSLTSGASDPQVLIIHTHGSEAYAPDGNYVESDSYRTQDREYSVMKVGEELKAALEAKGISVIHDTEFYDYPSYIGSYGRSLTATEAYVQQYPSIQVIIDLHRDALMEDDGTVYKTVAEVNGETCAQVMLVVGTNGTGLTHGDWSQNFALALKLQASMNAKYPSLARPVDLREERFNQHLSKGALLLEVGTNGNTLEEAIRSVGYFADCLEDVLASG